MHFQPIPSLVQSMHRPKAPQALAVVPAWHMPFESQQPVMHGNRLHGRPDPEELPELLLDEPPDEDAELPALAHVPALQVPPAAVQSTHGPPPTPHAVSLTLARHAPVVSQHPLHEEHPPLSELLALPASSPASIGPDGPPLEPLDDEDEDE